MNAGWRSTTAPGVGRVAAQPFRANASRQASIRTWARAGKIEYLFPKAKPRLTLY